MFLAAKRTRLMKRHFRVQRPVPRRVGDDTFVFKDTEILALEDFVMNRTNEYEFHRFSLTALPEIGLSTNSSSLILF
jgi:hypothetical protein